ncbi:ARPP-1 family domain-containing protein [Methanobacterium alcaliphilum]|uniref:ARPP-1 family domain-containing protein n=1 Tax=Methanobacterium alcaliphilum TaxID=392018 RepID=UPI00200AC3EE|nr:DUF6569 family protein [Methanobacterium alcaliphilum]MCK9152584.1 hypothetical protein [Methanobacterium alcaliphilum]
MNIRVIMVVAVIMIFAAGFGVLNYNNIKGLTLEEAYASGKVQITQETAAGTIPHTVQIQNKGKDPLQVEEGYILTSNSSQDLVTARNEIIPPDTNVTVPAYCLEPNQRAVEKSKLEVSGPAPAMIKSIISTSNVQNPSEAFNTQLRIWVIANGPEFNIYTGEVVAVAEKQDISYSNIRQNVSNVKIEIMTKFNLTESQVNKININNSIVNKSQSIGFDSIIESISKSLNL